MKMLKNFFVISGVVCLIIFATVYFLKYSNLQKHINICANNEIIEHNQYSKSLRDGSRKIILGMQREEVERIIGFPPDYFSFNDTQNRVTWHWTAGNRISCITKKLDIMNEKGHFSLTIIFNKNGQVEEKVEGVN